MGKNKTGKYFKYAIGEIVLVVIGILIALQVNNWNESRIQEKEAIKSLQNLEVSLDYDIGTLNWHLIAYRKTINAVEILQDYLNSDLPYHDSLNYHFGNLTNQWNPRINREAFETIKASNINTISNDSLKIEILAFYNYAENQFKDFVQRYINNIDYLNRNIIPGRFYHHEENLKEVYNELFLETSIEKRLAWIEAYRSELIPINPISLKTDSVFLLSLSRLTSYYRWFAEANIVTAKAKAIDLRASVRKELGKN